MRKTLVLIPLALAAAMGCGSSSKNEGKRVAIFVDDAYVDYSHNRADPDDPGGSEAYNMAVALNRMGGLDVVAMTVESFTSSVAGAKVLVVPEQEVDSIASDIPGDAVEALYKAVHDDGATLILGSAYPNTCALVNLVFEHSLGCDLAPSGSIAITGAATGTTFEGGADTLEILSATRMVDASTLPGGASVIYDDNNGEAAVVVIPEGGGSVIVLGWDFFDARPVGPKDGGWLDVFKAAVDYVAPVPL